MDLYREQLLDHYKAPRNWGLVDQFDKQEKGVNPLCGDQLTIQLVLKDTCVASMHFTGHGCAISIAAASLLSEAVVGTATADVLTMNAATMQELLGVQLPPARLKCGLLALKTVHLCLS